MAGSELLGLTGKGPTVFEELQMKQVLLSESLELQFWDLTDFPHTSKHVRLAAHSARTIHGDTVALCQRFSVTAKHIVTTLMPMLLDGIELAESSLVAGAFSEVLSCVTEMSSGANDVRSRYNELVSEIGECCKNVIEAEGTRTTENRTQITEIEGKKATAEETVRILKEDWAKCDKELNKLEEGLKNIDSEIKKHKEKRAVEQDNALSDKEHGPGVADHRPEEPSDQVSGRRGDEESSTEQPAIHGEQMHGGSHSDGEADFVVFDGNMDDNGASNGGYGKEEDPVQESTTMPYASWFKRAKDSKLGSTVTSIVNTVQSKMSGHDDSALEEKRREQEELHSQIGQMNDQMHYIRSNINAREIQIKDFGEQIERKEAEKTINSEGILKANDVLQAMILHVSDICRFWETMIENIRPLADERGASYVYDSTRESEGVRKIFMDKMMLSQKSWERLDGLCMEYVRHFHEDPVESLFHIFAFLSAPLGQPREVIEARTSELRKIVTLNQ